MGCEKGGDLQRVGSNPSEEGDLTLYTPAEAASDVKRSDSDSTLNTPESPRERVKRSNPVFAGGLTQRFTNAPISDTDIGWTSKSQDETPQEVRPPPEDGG